MTLAHHYPFTVYAITPGGHRFAVASYPTAFAAIIGRLRHMNAHQGDVTEVTDWSQAPNARKYYGK